jgi:hypothetical protein
MNTADLAETMEFNGGPNIGDLLKTRPTIVISEVVVSMACLTGNRIGLRPEAAAGSWPGADAPATSCRRSGHWDNPDFRRLGDETASVLTGPS